MNKEEITLALELLLVHEYELRKVGQSFKVEPAIKALEEALAKQEQGEHKESVRLECVVCKTVYEDGVPPQVAKQEQGEPVGEIISWPDDFSRLGVEWVDSCPPEGTKLYTTPQPAQKSWVGLTDEDCQKIVQNFCLNVGDWTQNGKSAAIAIENKLKEKNT